MSEQEQIVREYLSDGTGQDRCDRCSWPLAESEDKGCVVGNCSMRSSNLSDYRPAAEQKLRAALRALLSDRAAHEETRRRLEGADRRILELAATARSAEHHRLKRIELEIERQHAEAALEQARRELAEARSVWRCFHCGVEFKRSQEAIEHFGTQENKTPCGCIATIRSLASLLSCQPGEVVERVKALRDALERLRCDANRLCDRSLGGTYEQDCRSSIALADVALAPSRPASEPCSACGDGDTDKRFHKHTPASEPADLVKRQHVSISAAERAYGGIRPDGCITFSEFCYALMAYLFEVNHRAVEDPAREPGYADVMQRIHAPAPPASVAEQGQEKCGCPMPGQPDGIECMRALVRTGIDADPGAVCWCVCHGPQPAPTPQTGEGR